MRKGWAALAVMGAVLFGAVALGGEVSHRPYVDTDAHVSAGLREAVRAAVELGDPGDWQQFDLDESDVAILDQVAQLLEGNCLEPRLLIPLRFGNCGIRIAESCLEEARIVAKPFAPCQTTASP